MSVLFLVAAQSPGYIAVQPQDNFRSQLLRLLDGRKRDEALALIRKNPDALQAAVGLLMECDDNNKSAWLFYLLAEAGAPAVRAMKPYLESNRAESRLKALQLIEKSSDRVEDAAVIKKVEELATGDAEERVRLRAISALGRIRAPTSLVLLQRIIERDPDCIRRGFAVGSLAQYGRRAAHATPSLVEILKGNIGPGDDDVEKNRLIEDAGGALAQLGKEAAVALAKLLADGREPLDVRRRAARSLLLMMELFQSENHEEARAVVRTVIGCLADATGDIRRDAAWILGELRLADAAACGALRRMALSKDPRDSITACFAIYRAYGAFYFAFPILLAHLSSGDEEVRDYAADTLSEMEQTGSYFVMPFYVFLRHPNAAVRLTVVCLLSRLSPSRLLFDLLGRFARDTDPHVRDAAKEALKEFKR